MLAGGGFLIAVAINWIRAAATGWVALRIDRDGVTLGRHPMPGSRAVAVPWRDIQDVVVFYYHAPRHSGGPCVGLRLTPTAPRPSGRPPAGTLRGWLYRIFTTTSSAPADVHLGIRGWNLNRVAMKAAVRAFAPATRIVDTWRPLEFR